VVDLKPGRRRGESAHRKGEGLADIRFPSKGVEAADRMFAMVDQRIIRNISVGYSIDEVEVERRKRPASSSAS
jgi:hypothetical protein